MLTSLALIFLVGLSMAAICQKCRLPRIVGMLLTGIVLGPYVLDWLDPSILSISAELRKMALIIILLKAGLSLNIADLKKVGRPAVLMSCLPASFEILGYFLFAPYLLGITREQFHRRLWCPAWYSLWSRNTERKKAFRSLSWRGHPAMTFLSLSCLPRLPIWRRAGVPMPWILSIFPFPLC